VSGIGPSVPKGARLAGEARAPCRADVGGGSPVAISPCGRSRGRVFVACTPSRLPTLPFRLGPLRGARTRASCARTPWLPWAWPSTKSAPGSCSGCSPGPMRCSFRRRFCPTWNDATARTPNCGRMRSFYAPRCSWQRRRSLAPSSRSKPLGLFAWRRRSTPRRSSPSR
jgi:hypothetical protein